jgi:hypothetical protein
VQIFQWLGFAAGKMMYKLAIAGVAAVAILCSGVFSSPVAARHHWANGYYDVIRWSNGDCKIWHDDADAPFGTDWVLLRYNIRTYDRAWYRLGRLQARHKCS